jgi:hypothetical protein
MGRFDPVRNGADVGPGSALGHRTNRRLQSGIPCCQFPDTQLKPPTTDFSDLQPVTAQDPADAQFYIEKLALQKFASNEKGSGIRAADC